MSDLRKLIASSLFNIISDHRFPSKPQSVALRKIFFLRKLIFSTLRTFRFPLENILLFPIKSSKKLQNISFYLFRSISNLQKN